MPVTVLYPEARQQPDELERGIFGRDLNIVKRDTGALSELSDADCAEARLRLAAAARKRPRTGQRSSPGGEGLIRRRRLVPVAPDPGGDENE